MDPRTRLKKDLQFLYGSRAVQIEESIVRIIEQFRARHPQLQQPAQRPPFDQRDVILITYGDQFRRTGETPLTILEFFLDQYLAGVINGVHILPFYPYSSDDGFSVVNYYQVDPNLGTWEDIHRIGMHYRLMFDAVINHVSSKSAWFQAYLKGDLAFQDWFIEADPGQDFSLVFRPRTLPLLSPVETVTGTRWVWTTFSADQIDLNYANPQVLLEIIGVLLTYVSHGAHLLRLDAIAYLWKKIGTSCIHLPETHAVIRIFRAVLDLTAPDVLLITETNVPHRENISYFGDSLPGSRRTDEADLVYQFPLAPLVLHTLASGDATAISAWIDTLDTLGLFFNFIASHDGIGVTPAAGLLDPTQLEALVERALAHGGRVSYKRNLDGSPSPYELNITLYDALNDPAHPDPAVDIPRFLASQAILLSLAGVPGIYVHSLFGSSNCERCFEETGQPRSTSRQKFRLGALAAQLADVDSRPARILLAYHRLLQARVSHPAFDPRGGQRILVLPSQVLGLVRTSPEGNASAVCLVNVTSNRQTLAIDLVAAGLDADAPAQDLISGASFPVHVGGQPLVLEGYQTVWLASSQNSD